MPDIRNLAHLAQLLSCNLMYFLWISMVLDLIIEELLKLNNDQDVCFTIYIKESLFPDPFLQKVYDLSPEGKPRTTR